MGCSFDLRHQVSDLQDARLTVLPEYLDGAVIFFNHLALSLIGNPDYSVAHLQSSGFLRLHLMETGDVTLCPRRSPLAEKENANWLTSVGLFSLRQGIAYFN
jgi:hypothetical protein